MLASLVPTLEASSASVPSGIRRAASLYISARPRVPSRASPAACGSASSEPPSCAPYQKRNPLNTDLDATRGASVYVRADDASDTDAEAQALRENRADQLAESAPPGDVNEVVAILLDLASRDTPRLSSRFAGLLTASLGHDLTLRHNALRAANFKVLSAPDIPSALLELGYLSNPADEALLFSDAGRAELAAAVVAAIDRFFGVE